jgi:protein SCO1
MVVSTLVLCTPAWPVAQTHATTPDRIRSLPLLDQDGKPTSINAFAGRTLVLNFIFTHCVMACHTQVKSLKAVRAALPAETRARVRFLSVSIDPSRDTPDTLRQYARTMGIDDADWRVATASADHIAELARGLAVKRQSLPDGQIDHTLVVIVFDAQGRLIQRYAGAEVNTARLVREINDVVRLFDPAYQSISPTGQGR